MAELVARGLRFHVQRLGGGRPLAGAASRGAASTGAASTGAASTEGHAPPTVVFLHGLVLDNLSSWYFTVANPVAQVAPVLLYDLRGHGKSERPASGYSLSEHVADLAALLDTAEIPDAVILVGNSFGGVIALAFAAAHPQRTAGLVLVDAHTGTTGFGAQMAATLSLRGPERDQRIVESFRSWLGRHSEKKRTRLAESAEALVHHTTLVEELRASPPLSDAVLRSLTMPVLALYGSESDVRERGEALASLLPRCELRLFAGCTHSVLWEATEQVRAAIVEWVAGGR